MTASETSASEGFLAAAIDVGSSEVRLLIAELHADGRIEVLERAHRPVRLGHDTFVNGRISQDSIAAVIGVLRDYKHIMDTYKVQMVRAVATSAVREASNLDAFLDRVAMTVGLDIDVIEPTEQSRLIVAAVQRDVGTAVELGSHAALIAEVGGGSTLLTVLREGEIVASQGFNLGSIRMLEMLSAAHEPPARGAEMLRVHIGKTIELARKQLRLRSARTFLAIGGDARFAARQVGEEVPGTQLRSVAVEQLDGLIEQTTPSTPDDLARRHALAYADAETLVPALLVYQALLKSTRARQMIVSSVSMRDGLMLDLPRYATGEEDPALHASIIQSARTIGERYFYEEGHADHVANLAVRLFDALQERHGLQPRHRLLLQVAGLLHEVGVFVSSRAHHKHSYYLISNAEILGLRREDITTVAHVARYHRRSVPMTSHVDYMALPPQQRMAVNKLAAILRVADCLDRGHMRRVEEPEIEIRGRELVVYVPGAGDLSLERLALAEKADLLDDIFGLTVRLEEGRPRGDRTGPRPQA